MKELGKYGFDPMGRVDEIFRDETIGKQMPMFPDLVDFYAGILQIQVFDTKRQHDFVARVFDMRHCIVHNGGRPDARWIARTKGAKLALDQRLAERAVRAVDERLHQVSASVYRNLFLDFSKAPFKVPPSQEKKMAWNAMVVAVSRTMRKGQSH